MSQSQSMNLGEEAHMLMKKSLGLTTTSDNESQQQQRSASGGDADDKQHFYDKNVSFFDRISCEANEKNQKKPVNWKEERKVNAETFGVRESQTRYRFIFTCRSLSHILYIYVFN